ncbi:hypothetical protein HHX47_DHR6000443 [Lentinula edodes]|nr:hypothetical protein HHX47_DHR6000443 [Lentinula edodes]
MASTKQELTYETPMKCPTGFKERGDILLPGKDVPAKYQLDRVRSRRDLNHVKPEKLYGGFGVNIPDCIEYHRKHNLGKQLTS